MDPGDAEPLVLLHSLVERINSTPEPDLDLIMEVGVGDLENLLQACEGELWPEIERLARSDSRFRRALSHVWAYGSSEFERRAELLRQLGEHWPVTVRFVVEPRDFTPAPWVSWRAVQVIGEPEGRQLSRLLREIADWYDNNHRDEQLPFVFTRPVFSSYLDWSKATDRLRQLWYEITIAPDAQAVRRAALKVRALKDAEQEAFASFLGAVSEASGKA